MEKRIISHTLLVVTVLTFLYLESHADITSTNTMSILSDSVNYHDTITIPIRIDNMDPFIAFQLDLVIPGEFECFPDSVSLNPARITDHTVSAELISDDTLRIISYSPTNSPFLENNGAIAFILLEASTDPGDYPLEIINPVLGDSSSVNILTGHNNGSLTLLAPDIDPGLKQLNFGAIPLGDSLDKTLTIFNEGNLSLEIQDISINCPYFTILGSTSVTIPSNSNYLLSIRFNSLAKGIYQPDLLITSDDPDEQISNVDISAESYTINEIHTGNITGFNGDTVEHVFTINNMEQVIGFQFDMTLPHPLVFIPESESLSTRKQDHVVDANLISSDILRIIAYSPTNQAFTGNSGDILTLRFVLDGLQGTYGLNLSNCVIGNEYGENVISDFYNGVLEVAAPDISCSTSIDFGDISLLDLGHQQLSINNLGLDTLEIEQVIFSDPIFYTNTVLPLNILPGSSSSLDLYLDNNEKGTIEETIELYSNDPDESPLSIILSAYSYAPNYAHIPDVDSYAEDTVSVFFNVDNYETFNSFQFELIFPSFMTFLPDSTRLTNRAQDHIIQTGLTGQDTLQVFSYSLSLANFTGSTGAVASFSFAVDTNGCLSYPLSLDNVLLVDSMVSNIIYDHQDGIINLLGPLITTWTGDESVDWLTTGNWDVDAPSAVSTAIINGTPANQPVLNFSTTCNKLIMDQGSEVIINPGAILTISDSLIIHDSLPGDTTKMLINGGIILPTRYGP